ncbi:MAG TPA: RHS repeat-associated core domain-containing protein, partial [Verrucomicrobiae bacterium]|nr:RHS repeat-associated core domain-containing protein [Verrucomicrobiae bacterium]
MGCATSAGQTRDRSRAVPAVVSPVNPGPQSVVTSYYFNDFDGNVDALVSPGGMILAQYEYDPFGNLIAKGGLMAELNKYRFSSKEWDDNANLYYYGRRFYDPNLQRWINRDPIQELGGIN